MIAFGEPFIQMLEEIELTLTEYFVLYCYVYEKTDLIDRYDKLENYSTDTALSKLLKKKLLVHFETDTLSDSRYLATEAGEIFIKEHVTSYMDAITDNPLLGEEDLSALSESSYEKDFQILLDTYPVKVTRSSGRSSYLKEGTKEIKRLYIKALETKEITALDLQKAIEHYVGRYTQTGNTAYMKTLKNWFSQDIWKDVMSNMKTESTNTTKRVDYGGRID